MPPAAAWWGVVDTDVHDITDTYSTGAVTGACPEKHGLTKNTSVVRDSYWDTDLSGIADDSDYDSPEGLSTALLQTPTNASGIYSGWSESMWDFGTDYQHPVLRFGGLSTSTQFQAQPDTPPAFAATMSNRSFGRGRPIEPFQVPAARGGNGALEYAASGLPQGLSLGTARCATARTVCGTPAQATTSLVAITVSDADPEPVSLGRGRADLHDHHHRH